MRTGLQDRDRVAWFEWKVSQSFAAREDPHPGPLPSTGEGTIPWQSQGGRPLAPWRTRQRGEGQGEGLMQSVETRAMRTELQDRDRVAGFEWRGCDGKSRKALRLEKTLTLALSRVQEREQSLGKAKGGVVFLESLATLCDSKKPLTLAALPIW